MKKTVLKICLVMLILGSFNRCAKYEEGPSFSLRSKKARLANTWTLRQAITTSDINGQITTTTNKGDGSETFTIEKDGTWQSNGINGVSGDGTWEFKGETGLRIKDGTTNVDYEILKLRNKELWLKQTNTSTILGITGIITVESHFEAQ